MGTTLLLLDLEDRHFLTHRHSLAVAARDAGYRVRVCVMMGGEYADRIRAEGFECVVLGAYREGFSLFRELQALCRIVRVYRAHRPQIAHHFGVRSLLHGAIAAWLAHTPAVVHSYVGLGALFTSGSFKLNLWRRIVVSLLRRFQMRKNTWVIAQNGADKETLLKNALTHAPRLTMIRGSGVDTRAFQPSPEPPGAPLAVLASRMLADKGIHEFVEAAALLKKRNVQVRMALAGKPDPKNPRSIPESTLSKWHRDGAVEWWGYREDMPEVWRGCHIAVLPSYREGLPKSLLEAAACGRPLVATDAPGCREVVRDGTNGLCVPPRDPERLADAIGTLAQDAGIRRKMGEAGRQIVETEFSDTIVVRQIFALYDRISGAAMKRGGEGGRDDARQEAVASPQGGRAEEPLPLRRSRSGSR